MINSKIIKIASNTKNVGLTDKYSFRSNLKNSMCGDKIKLELTVKNSKINSMKYELEACVYCEASASLLASKIKNKNINKVIKDLNLLKSMVKDDNYLFPVDFKDFKLLINKKNYRNINCINLPLEAVLKALR